ncbi:MAG: SDR family oxidoreductase [Clostridiales bacterium]|nr:SDR family oxidoreductase [Clostridiales bacterium]
MSMTTTERRVALVTGSGKGVGAGIVKRFCSEGIRCCINCNANRTMAEKTLQEIEAAGGEAFIYQADVSKPEQMQAMVDAIIEKWGRLDILVNNAAMQPMKFVDQYDVDTLQWLWEINIGGYVRAVQTCLPHLRKSPQGRVVNISSIHGKRPTNFDAGYAMTKGAIRMFTRELALELLKDGITVNAIDLGGCKIEFKTGNPEMHFLTPVECTNPRMPLRFLQVEPKDVADLVWFLCSDEAGNINGDGIRLDRGAVLI